MGFKLLHDEVLPPVPRQSPLLAIRINRFSGIQVCKHIPVHDFELLVQPFCIQVLPVGDHSSHTYLLRGRNDRARCNNHLAGFCNTSVLAIGNDLQAQRPINVLLLRAVGARVRHFYPFRNRLLLGILVSIAILLRWDAAPSFEKAFLRAVAQARLRDIPDKGLLVRVVETRPHNWAAKPAIVHVRASSLVLKLPAIPVLQADVHRYL
mmetsp:Transcript_3639/g.8815  ORF Transcript_3639/g.8815 Transcript_3639/m.8815 type:complete len:208 (-) Transcript_3639:184-807(-)